MANGKGHVITFVPHKDPDKAVTKGCFRFEEVVAADKSPIVGGLYVKKYAYPNGMPKKLTVTITE